MTAEPGSRVEEVFHAALERAPDCRAAFLDEACKGDPSLRRSVEELLNAIERRPDFLEKPAWSRFVQPGAAEGTHHDDMKPEQGLPFESLGEYRLIRRLGAGGMGTVYLAVQESLGRRVALKVIRSERAGTFEAEARFGREVQAISKLRHPNIVTVLGSGEDQDVRYFAMELIQGKGLDELLHEAAERGEKLPLQQVLKWIHGIAWALDAAHQAGIIHRDVKPSNIMITPDNHPMLMDFSVARYTKLLTLTLTGEFRGTPHYASPEQVKASSRGIDFRTDIYSLGVTLYEAAAGCVPFNGETTEQVFHQILAIEPKSPRLLNSEISADLETVITKAMEKDPARRYRTMADFALDLRCLVRGDHIAARPASLARKSARWIQRHKVISFAAAALLLLAGAVSLVLMEKAAQQRQQFETIRERYKPVNEAITRRQHKLMDGWKWCREVDPGAPCGRMLQALFALEEGRWKSAAPALEECLSSCRERGDTALERDAHYLLGLVRLAKAEEGGEDREEKRSLLESARQALLDAGEFDPVGGDALVWRDADPEKLTPAKALAAIQSIRIDSEHFLVNLNNGISIFENLHRGGEIQEFEVAIELLEKARTVRPDNVPVLTFLGRTYYFFARSFDFLDMVDRAESCLDRAFELAGDRPSHMVLNTLGAVCLLRGKNDKALALNRKALKQEKGNTGGNIHNVYSGIGKALARKGRLDEAEEYYRKALELQPSDVSARIALTELVLQMDREEEALEMLRTSAQRSIRRVPSDKSDYLQAPVYLLCCRIHLKNERYDEATVYLKDLYLMAIHSSSIFSQACHLIGTFPEDRLRHPGAGLNELVTLTGRLVQAAIPARQPGERMPPICLSASGVSRHLYGYHQMAVDSFEKAMEERKRWWPGDLREFYWTEDARDLYFLAMIHKRLAEEPEGKDEHEARARSCFEQAEALFARGKLPIETADIIRRVRAKARSCMNER